MPPTSISAARFTLEPLAPKHADAIYTIRGFPDVYIWTYATSATELESLKTDMSSMAGRWKSPEDSIDWITTCLAVPGSLQFVMSLDLTSPLATEIDTAALTIVDGAAIIGSIGSVRDAELGYMLHPAVWGKRIGPEALRAYIPAYFATMKDKEKLNAFTDTLNTRSRKVLERTGFTWVLSEPYESVELGSRHADNWEITRDAVKKWETESS